MIFFILVECFKIEIDLKYTKLSFPHYNMKNKPSPTSLWSDGGSTQIFNFRL